MTRQNGVKIRRTPKQNRRGPVDFEQAGFLGNKVVQVQRGITPFAAQLIARMRYASTITVVTPNMANTAGTYSFRLNSLYDPDYSGTGHQPYQYDQLTGIYNNYLVDRCDFKVTFRPDFTTDGIFVGASVFADTDATDSSAGLTWSVIKEKATTQLRPVATQSNRANYPILRGSIDMARVFGISKPVLQAEPDQYGAVYSANPARTVFLELCALDPGANASSDCFADVELTFFCRFWGYKGPSQS